VISGWTTPQQIKARKLTIQNCPAQGVQSANSVMVDGKQDKDEALSINEYLGWLRQGRHNKSGNQFVF
jgi:hypothetical protein